MRPSEVFQALCEELKIENFDERNRAELIFQRGYKKGKDDEWLRVCRKIDEELGCEW